MRILHFIGSMRLPLDPEREAMGGVARVTLETARAQAALGHEVWVAAVAAASGRGQWNGVRLVNLKTAAWARVKIGRRVRDLREHLPLVALTATRRFDVVHVHEYWQLRFLRAKTRIVQVHNDPFGALGTPRFARKARGFWRRARASCAQVAVSRFVAERLQRGYDTVRDGVGFESNIHTAYNGVDQARFAAERWADRRRVYRQQWGADESDVVFLFAGALTPQKGVIHLAQAFAELCSQAPGVRLVVAGGRGLWRTPDPATDAEYRTYEAQARAVLQPAILQGKAHLLGIVPPEDLPAIYAASDVVVIPSVVDEAFGLVAAEALATGRPVVASRVGALPELVTEENGLLVAPADAPALHSAMRRLVDDAGLRARLGARARSSVLRFTWGETARTLERIYAQVAGPQWRRGAETNGTAAGSTPDARGASGRPAPRAIPAGAAGADGNGPLAADA